MKNLKVLMIDDSKEDRESFRRALKRDSVWLYDFIESDSGEEGLELCRSVHPDVILLDYSLPDTDGIEMLKELSAGNKSDDLPVIMLTGAGNEAVAVEAMKSGAADYMVKDMNGHYLQLLPQAVNRLLERQRLIAEAEQAREEQKRLIAELEKALAEVKTLRGFIPICAGCKKIRDDRGFWQQVEKYISDRSDAKFSHDMCPDCIRKMYPEIADEILKYPG